MLRNYLARRKMRWAVRCVADAHEHTCPGEALTVARMFGALFWTRTTHHSSGFCYSRAAMLFVQRDAHNWVEPYRLTLTRSRP